MRLTSFSMRIGLLANVWSDEVKITGSRRNISHKRPNSSISFICDNILRMVCELSEPNFNASVGNVIPVSRFRNSGNTAMHRSTSAWLKATIR